MIEKSMTDLDNNFFFQYFLISKIFPLKNVSCIEKRIVDVFD